MDAHLFRSAQLYGEYCTPLLKNAQIATLINLRGKNPRSTWYNPERNTCSKLGIVHIDSPLHSRRLPQKEMLSYLLRAFNNALTPILIKCSGGADRTALASAIYLLNIHGVDGLKEVDLHLKFWPYLHLPGKHQRWIKQFPSFFSDTHNGSALFDWVEDTYTPELFGRWLVERQLGDTWRN